MITVVDQVSPASLAMLRYVVGFLCLLPLVLLAPRVRFARRDILPIALLGIARSHGVDLRSLARSITTDDFNDISTEALRLLVCARHNAPLTAKEWARVSDLIQGVGQMDLGLRVQLAWIYLEQLGKGEQAIREALK